jgi:hypothetical protein
MEGKVIQLIASIDIEEEIRENFNITLDEVVAVYITKDALTLEKLPDQTGQRVALQSNDPWNQTNIIAYFGYYWFKEPWINWEITSNYLLKRYSVLETGFRRYVIEPRNDGSEEAYQIDPQRFWTFKFDNFQFNSVNFTPFKQVVKEGGDYVRFKTHVLNF